MSHTKRRYKDIEYNDKSTKKKSDRKRFVFQGEGWTTKARGGVGNKRAWGGKSNLRGLPKWLYKKYKEKLNNNDN